MRASSRVARAVAAESASAGRNPASAPNPRLSRKARSCRRRWRIHRGAGGGKQDVSRVLFSPADGRGGDHLSGTAVTGGLERRMGIGTGKMANRCPWALLPAGVYRAGTSRCRWCALTAPLHPCLCTGAGEPSPGAIGGVFLWHCPHGHPHWALPSRPGHWGARTFLNRPRFLPVGSAAPVAITSPAFRFQDTEPPEPANGRAVLSLRGPAGCGGAACGSSRRPRRPP